MKLCYISILALVTLILSPHSGPAQTAPLNYRTQSYPLDTGRQSSRPGEMVDRIAYSDVVKVPGAAWLRLRFSDAVFGKGSYLIVTSIQDGKHQRLDALSLMRWGNTSAYFNGNAIKLELHVAPNDHNVFVRMRDVVVGDQIGNPETQCGPVDDRIASTDPRAGRLLTIGCTGWLIADGRLVTAGHCSSSAGLLNTVEFNVPPSLPNGTLQHPGPEDQYTVDDSTRVFSDAGIGNDWGVFSTFPNSETGLTPLQAQGVWFDVAQDLSPATIRITGYGVDDGAANQTEQTSTGPNAGSSGTTMRYKTDTEGGNSGSPVIDEATGRSVGVHTNGGCTTSGSGFNSGTSNFNTDLWAQIGTGGGGDIVLEARVRRQGGNRLVSLQWAPADGGSVNIMRNGAVIGTTADDGNAQDKLGTLTGTFTYQVCETDSGDCSNEVRVRVQ